MAADVGQRISGWTYSDVPYSDNGPQDPLIQQMVLNHGSVSFGRFAAEPLSWEKRSVFDRHSRQEELSKLTAPGLVAQKKAFFEEYFKKARRLKAQGAMQMQQTQDQLPAVISDDPVENAPTSTFEPSTELSSSDEGKCQEAHDIVYRTFNPLFSQTAGLQSIQQEERSSSDEKKYLDREFPCATNTNNNHGHIGEALERKILAPRRVVSDDNSENNVAKTRIVLPIASLQQQGLKVVCEKQGARKIAAHINRPMKKTKDLSTSVIRVSGVDFRRNSENRHSQDLKDPFHKRVEMKFRALLDRMNADKAAVSSRSASYQPPDRAMATYKSSYQNAGKLANSSISSLHQNTGKFLAPSKSAAQASHRSHKGVHVDALPRGIFFNKDSNVSYVASSNSTATGKPADKILLMPSSSQVTAKTSKNAQVTSKGAAELTRLNNASRNKRKQLSTPAASDENKPKRGYVRKSMSRSARSSSDNAPPTTKVPKISNRTNETKVETSRAKSEFVQKSISASHPVAGRNSMKNPTASSNEQNRKVTSTRAGGLAGSSVRSNLTGGPSRTKNKPRQERPRWR